MHRDQLRLIKGLSKEERRELSNDDNPATLAALFQRMREKQPTIDELRKMSVQQLALIALGKWDPFVPADFWQLTGMIAARLHQDGERAFSTLLMECGREFDNDTLLRVCHYLAKDA